MTRLTDESAIAAEDAAHVLMHAGRGGWPGSNFRRMLLAAMDTADAPNLDRLAAGFPGLVAAYRLVRAGDDGVAQLIKIAEGESGAEAGR